MKSNFVTPMLALVVSFFFALNANAQWTSNASNVYLTAANVNKKVGIGTSTPSAKLHLKGGDFRMDNNGQFFDLKVDAAGNLKIERNGTTTAMIIGDANGNVGIGTTTVPAAKLHVRNGDFRLDQSGQYFDFKVDASGNLRVERNGSTTAMIIGDNNGNVGIGATYSTIYKLRVNGSAFATGSWTTSDKRYKDNIQTLDNALAKVLAMRGTAYSFRRDEFKTLNFEEGKHFGFIAQELKEVMPELVKEDEHGYQAVNYDGVVPVLVEAMKEQQSQIQDLDLQIEVKDAAIQNLEARLAKLEALLSQIPLEGRSSESPAAVEKPTVETSTIFPNPSKNGDFTVQFPASSMDMLREVAVFDALGKEVARQTVEAGATSARMELPDAVPGTYFVHVTTAGKASISKLTVIK